MKKALIQTFTFGLTLLSATWAGAAPMGTAFTYQGRLYDDGVPANGEYQIRFGLFDRADGGINLGVRPSEDPIPPITVSGGLFTTTLDFGVDVFSGEARFLQIAVRKYNPAEPIGSMNPLLPRQELKPAPYALYAGKAGAAAEAAHATNADSAASVPWGSASIIGLPAGFADGVDNDTTYSAGLGLRLSGTTFSFDPLFGDGRYWTALGNSGTDPGVHFLGTTDNRALTMRVNDVVGLRVLPMSLAPTVIGGSAGNQDLSGLGGAFIGGGVSNTISGRLGVIGGGNNNQARSSATVGGGSGHLAGGLHAVVAGGVGNHATAEMSTVGGGGRNLAAGYVSTIAGGIYNTNLADYATVGGGFGNRATGQDAVVAGGSGNLASSGQSTVGGGIRNSASGSAATVAGGEANVSTNSYATVSGGFGNRASSHAATIGGGSENFVGTTTYDGGGFFVINDAPYSATLGGRGNRVSSDYSVIGSGWGNQSYGDYSFIGGGLNNRISTPDQNSSGYVGATIAGGLRNQAYGGGATVGGGEENEAGGFWSAIPGGLQANARSHAQLAFAGGMFQEKGDAQSSIYVLRGVSSAATPTELFLDGSSRRMWVPANGVWAFEALIIGKRVGSLNVTGIRLEGIVANVGGAMTVSTLPPVTRLGSIGTGGTWTAVADIDNPSRSLVIKVTGQAGAQIRWVATVRTTELIAP